MKWFKHFTDASEGKTLQNLYRKFGLEGEARFWRLVQLLAAQYDGSSDTFYLSLETIRGSLRLRSLNDCRPFLDHLATISELKVNYSGNDCEITYSKLSKIKDNHTKDLQATSKRLASNLPLEENRIDKEEEKRKREEPPSPSSVFLWNASRTGSGPEDIKSPDQLITLWNNKSTELGVPFSALSLSHSNVINFYEISKMLEQNKYTWKMYLDRITSSSAIMLGKAIKLTLVWAVNPKNFDKVMSGQYDDQPEEAVTSEDTSAADALMARISGGIQ